MWTIRAFEQGLEELFQRGLLHGTMHLSIGQEAVATGVCGALAEGDLITSTHRGHGHCLAHGADPERMMAELLAKESGYCKGRGGSMHIADVSRGNLGANGIVAGSMTIAAGAALAQQQQGSDAVVVCFFGDGAANEGAFHEALNLAGIWDLPVIYVCENNQYGMSMATARAAAGNDIAGRGAAYGLPGTKVNGNDILAVREATLEAAARARAGEGASLIEAVTYRYRGHSKSDRNLYRTREEITEWRDERDPIDAFTRYCTEHEVLSEQEITAASQRGKDTIKEAVAGAMTGAEPDPTELAGAAYAANPGMEGAA
ncbi:thiamine pyrophosphate-dependent dehydrogenase E1 component subunit alpha [Euzebya tangerina]|uniref:thiamine pyrophosphate-dependent dehydrogenase E1 component subunit alpha n=1 Tax=Euzebya tangerina TaxID=591198 RepID=UPI000E30EB2A